ncbi:tetratricopeptide repeat protein [Acaryochloris sp. IP29b_bin.137]|uniref:tetratricopeptide repeat protein n=1 Tax=Acaryochloris sp. IP29b_bin.137 TaxID=2969217 RepID=UPI002617D92C|nr:tetratricopeptide repeat protein [Acaryochloris sp. IP29b_bin.137]
MDNSLASVYLGIFLVLVCLAGWFVFRQVLKTRKSELTITKLESKFKKEVGTVEEYYELGSIYLRKKLYVQAVSQLKKALKAAESEMGALPSADTAEDEDADASGTNPIIEPLAPLYNALGYAYFGQEQFDLAIRNYKEALKCKADYLVAMNNLGHAYERKKLMKQALETYDEVLSQDPKNDTAKRRSRSLRKQVAVSG